MKKSRKLRIFALSAAFLGFGLSVLGTGAKIDNVVDDGWEGDNASYREDSVKKLINPDARVEGEEEEIPVVNQLVLHYHNDDGKCKDREFYLWAEGVAGLYLASKTEYVDSSGKASSTDMMITLDFTGEFSMFAGKDRVGLIIKYTAGWDGQSEDTYLEFSKFPPDANGKVELWIIPGEGSALDVFKTEAETKMDKVITAKFIDWKTIRAEATIKPEVFRLYAFDETYYRLDAVLQEQNKNFYLFKSGTPDKATFDIKLNYQAHINVTYMLETEYSTAKGRIQMINVGFENLYKNPRFVEFYNYKGDDLGVTYTKEKTTFKVWAPTSTYMKLNLYSTGTPKKYATDTVYGSDSRSVYDMVYQKGGVWAITIEGDLDGKYYTFQVQNQGGNNETVDPYVKAVGVNGLRGMVVDWERTNPTDWDKVTYKDISTPQELTIYETHIRDVTMHKTWGGTEEPGTFNAFVEKGTKYQGVTTGYDHIEEVGPTAVQLLPVYDSDHEERPGMREYNWSYDPLNYNCVEGSYASDPYDGAVRIKEYKNLIKEMSKNKNNTRVIMDVVYNHVQGAPNSSFQKLMPRYYFRFNSDWAYYNGSGCGNEVKSEAPMMRKFIVESVKWWASEYKIKGFRFDLMGLLDTKTMNEVAKEVHKIDEDIYVYGEGWMGGYDTAFPDGWHGDTSGGTYSSNSANVYLKLYENGVGGFNDEGRNALKGKNGFGGEMYGFISQDATYGSANIDPVKRMLIGTRDGGGNPAQTVNYASCHDNFTLFDQFTYTSARDGKQDYPGMALAATVCAESAVLVSNGVGFIQGGEELFRSKVVKSAADKEKIKQVDTKGNVTYKDTVTINGKMISHNSYNLSDEVNAFDYSRKIEVDGVSTKKYYDAILEAVAARKQMKKFTLGDMKSMSGGNTVNCWTNASNGGSGMVIGMANESSKGSYYFFISGEVEEKMGFGNVTSSTCIASSNKAYGAGKGYVVQDVTYSDGFVGKGIKMGWSSCALFKLN